MREIKALILILFAGMSFSFGQMKGQQDPEVIVSGKMRLPAAGIFMPSEIQEDWAPGLRNTSVIHEPRPGSVKDLIQKRKAAVNAMAQTATGAVSNKVTATDPPVIGAAFEGQKPNGYPNDNHVAISNGGKIVSVTNSIMYTYDESGGQPESVTSLSVLGDAAGAGSNTKFDPRVIYDPLHDRFIVVFLSGIRSNTSELVVGFSRGNNPAVDGWNMYTTTGNTHPVTWSDFPQIGISTYELFVTCNQYEDDLTYVGSTVWQMDLSDGYAGNGLSFQTYLTNYFSLHPVTGGTAPYGPNFYMIRLSEVVPNRLLAIHQITHTIDSGGVLNSPVSLQSDRVYDVPPDAQQPGTPAVLLTNDHRIQDSYLEGNNIHWVSNTAWNGRPGIYYGTVELSAFDLIFSAVKGKYIIDPILAYAYPSLSYAGWSGSYGKASIIGFNYVSNNDFPGCGAMLVDGEGDNSAFLECRKGKSYLGAGTETNRRWGDYTGLATRYDNIGEAWLAGSFGNINGGSDTWFTQLYANSTISVPEPPEEPKVALSAGPVPAFDILNVSLEVSKAGNYVLEVRDLQGRMIRELIRDYLRPGIARASFNTAVLATGTYLLVVQNEEGIEVFSKKIVVSH